MTTITTTASLRRIPLLRERQVMLFDEDGVYTGYYCLDDQVRRFQLNRRPTNRCTVFDFVAFDCGAATSGTIFETEFPDAIGASGKPRPHLTGKITLGNESAAYEVAVWRNRSSRGDFFFVGHLKPAARSPSQGQRADHDPAQDGPIALGDEREFHHPSEGDGFGDTTIVRFRKRDLH